MFFYLAKVLWFLLQPSTLIALLIAYGAILIWTGWARWGRRFVSVGAALLLIAGLSPLGNALILPLEDRFQRTNLDQPPPPTGFIVLGGAEDRLVGTARKAPALNEAGERIVETVMLAGRFPEAKIAFTGGDAGILYKSDSEAIGARHRSLMDLPGMRERTVKIGSAGKIFGLTGWKVGWMCAAPPLTRVLARAHQFLTFTTPPNLQWAVAAGLSSADAAWLAVHALLDSASPAKRGWRRWFGRNSS